MTSAVIAAQHGSSNFTFRNRIINGNFDIWQRGTSFSNPSGDTYTADRFVIVSGGSTTGDSVTQQTFTPGQTDVPGEPTYFFRYTAGATSSNKVIHHRVEDVRTFAGQTCTLSFWAKASAAHTSTIELAQNFGSAGSANVTQSAVNYTMSTSWQKFTFTTTLPSIAGKTIGAGSYVYIAFIRSLPASNISIDIAQMQFEAGSTATPFEYRPIGTELALCQRYFISYGGTTGYERFGVGMGNGATTASICIALPVPMRVAPTLGYSAVGDIGIYDGANVLTATVIALDQPSEKVLTVAVTVATGGTQYRPMALIATNNTAARLRFTAEI
jgi:hypothetical protein